MKSGTCPKCQSANVFEKQNGIDHYQGIHVYTGKMTFPSPFVSYVCTDCGYYENYIADPTKLADIAAKWERATPSG